MNHRDLTREPCPDRIVEDLGGAFSMGLLGGYAWHFCSGWRNAPKYEKLKMAMFKAGMKAPPVSGAFAMWGGIFCASECSLVALRGGKEDVWNPIMGGALTGGLLSMRAGLKSSVRNALVGGLLLGVIEFVQMMFQRTQPSSTPRRQYQDIKDYELYQQREASKTQEEKSSASTLSPELSSFSRYMTPWLPTGSASELLQDASRV